MILTDRQHDILNFIRSKSAMDGRSPSMREICKAFDFASPNAAECHLKALEAKGAIQKRTSFTARALRAVDTSPFPCGGGIAIPGCLVTRERAREIAAAILKLTEES